MVSKHRIHDRDGVRCNAGFMRPWCRGSGWAYRCVCVLSVLLWVFTATPLACGQENTADTRLPRNEILNSGTLPFEAEMFFQDETGQLVFHPSIPLEELRRLQQLDSGKGAFEFSEVTVDARVTGETAEVRGTFQVQLGADAGYAEVPLNFGTCQIGLQKPNIDDGGDRGLRSHLVATPNGYRWLLFPGRESRDKESLYKIVLDGKSKLINANGRRALRIALPLQSCQIKILLPANATDEQVGTDEVIERKTKEEGVELTVLSRGGDFNISWKSKDEISRFSTVEAESQTQFEIGDPQAPWSATTTLTIRWYGDNANDTFRIQLPPGATWRIPPQDDFERFQVTRVESPPDPNRIQAEEYLLRNTDPDQFSTIDNMVLEWEFFPDLENEISGDITAQVAVPTVSDLDSHRGFIDCICPAEYIVRYETAQSAAFTQQSLITDPFAWQQLQFRFGQPDFDLSLSFRKESILPTIRPLYHVDLDGSKMVLTAWLDISFTPNQHAPNIGIDFGNWLPQDNSATAFALESEFNSEEGELLQVQAREDGSYSIMQPLADRTTFESNRRLRQIWKITAEQLWQPDGDSLEFALPALKRAGTEVDLPAASGVLIVTAADRLLLKRQDDLTQGLLSDAFTPEYKRFVPQSYIRQPLVYRFRSSQQTPTWNGRVEFLPQSVALQEQVRLQFVGTNVTVTQDWELKIANVPVTRPRIAVPIVSTEGSSAAQAFTAVTGSASPGLGNYVRFEVNGALTTAKLIESLTPAEFGERAGLSNESRPQADKWEVYELTGAPAMDRSASLSIAYTLPSSALDPTEPGTSWETLQLPLCRLLDPQSVVREKRTLSVDDNMRAMVLRKSYEQSQRWQSIPRGEALTMDPQATAISLRVSTNESQQPDQLLVTNSWLQSIVSTEGRQDRYVARFKTGATEIRIRLNEDINLRPNAWRITLDGTEILDSYLPSEDIFVVPLPEATKNGDREHSVELIYSVMNNLENWSVTRVSVEVPQILGAQSIGRFYWQIATPRTQHLAWTPAKLMPEWSWEWNGAWWHREDARKEQNLLNLLNVDELRLPASSNRYLLSGDLTTDTLQLWIVPRFLLWFPIGLVAIGIATLVVNYRSARHPVAAMILALLVGTFAMIFPDLGFLFGQTAIVALGLVSLVFVTHAAIESRLRRRSVFSPRTSIEGSDRYALPRSSKMSEILPEPTSTAVGEGS